MADHFTACLASAEATVTAILTGPNFNHTYVETFGPFSGGVLNLNIYEATVATKGVCAAPGDKVLIHTTT